MKEEHIEEDGSLGKINYKSNTSPNYDSLDKWLSRNKCKLNNKDLNLIRDWIKSEILATFESLENDFGFNDNSYISKQASDDLFDKIKSIFGEYK